MSVFCNASKTLFEFLKRGCFIWHLRLKTLPLQRSSKESGIRIVLWCNGSTTGFGSVCPGSNPGRTTTRVGSNEPTLVVVWCSSPKCVRGMPMLHLLLSAVPVPLLCSLLRRPQPCKFPPKAFGSHRSPQTTCLRVLQLHSRH